MKYQEAKEELDKVYWGIENAHNQKQLENLKKAVLAKTKKLLPKLTDQRDKFQLQERSDEMVTRINAKQEELAQEATNQESKKEDRYAAYAEYATRLDVQFVLSQMQRLYENSTSLFSRNNLKKEAQIKQALDVALESGVEDVRTDPSVVKALDEPRMFALFKGCKPTVASIQLEASLNPDQEESNKDDRPADDTDAENRPRGPF